MVDLIVHLEPFVAFAALCMPCIIVHMFVLLNQLHKSEPQPTGLHCPYSKNAFLA